MEETIVKARRLLKEALEEDAELYRGYACNVSCLLMDSLDDDSLGWEDCDEFAKKLLHVIFGVENPDA